MQAVVDRANKDPQFLNRLRADPAAAFREAGETVPPGAKFELIDCKRGDIHLLLGSRSGTPELDRILERADRDPGFKQGLLRDPRSVIETHTGQKLPSQSQVHVREGNPQAITLFLRDPSEAVDELSEEDLQTVSGGIGAFVAGFLVGSVFVAGVAVGVMLADSGKSDSSAPPPK